MEEKYLTVSALTRYIKYKFDKDLNLQNVLLEGEISNFKRHSRGHFYFTLKDENTQITAMMFQSYASKVDFEPKDGDKVLVKGNVTVYEATGSYQIVVKEMKVSGAGDLYIAYEKLKKELESLGLFDASHKLPIPSIPKVVGVITSPTGAAIHDILTTIERRFPLCRVILYPALVQGEGAKESIVKQIKKANDDKLCDVLIVGRGGGSIEDLWAFNEKIVAYAIYESQIPIISAVGHEVDFTIADFVADRRAPTPTGAAEMATPDKDAIKESIGKNIDRLNQSIKLYIENLKVVLGNIDKRLEALSPNERIKNQRNILKELYKKLDLLIGMQFDRKALEFKLLKERLELLNPLSIMDKGYSIASTEKGIIRSIKEVKENDDLSIKVVDGQIKTKVIEVIGNGK